MSENGKSGRAAAERRVLLADAEPAAERQARHEQRNTQGGTFEDPVLERIRRAMPDESPLQLDKHAATIARQIEKAKGAP